MAPPDFMKCDVEGAELLMFQRAERLLSSPRPPTILAEANATASRALGYRSSEIPYYLLSQEAAAYSNVVEEWPHRLVRTCVFPKLNRYILAVPESRLARLPDLLSASTINIDSLGIASFE